MRPIPAQGKPLYGERGRAYNLNIWVLMKKDSLFKQTCLSGSSTYTCLNHTTLAIVVRDGAHGGATSTSELAANASGMFRLLALKEQFGPVQRECNLLSGLKMQGFVVIPCVTAQDSSRSPASPCLKTPSR